MIDIDVMNYTGRTIQYTGHGNAIIVFIPKCENCGRYVKANETVKTNERTLISGPNAECSKCGPTKMILIGYI